jgi:hypothetical protein
LFESVRENEKPLRIEREKASFRGNLTEKERERNGTESNGREGKKGWEDEG